MPRQIQKLTAIQVAKLTKPGVYADGGNLYLQITPAGVKSWLFRFMLDGKPQAMGLGPVHTVSLKEARELALEKRRILLSGSNPLALKQQEIAAAKLANAKKLSFDQCAESYIEAHRASWRNAKHASQWTSTIKTYASPFIGLLPVADVDTDAIVRCLTPIWETKNETASRLRGRIESILSWATTSGLRTGENPARWKGHLKNLLATIKKKADGKHHPSLPWPQLPGFYKSLQQCEGIAARALEFAILTACRSGDVRGATWGEIDFKRSVWVIPAERIKMKREHEVPLSEQAIKLLKATPKVGKFIFPGIGGEQMSDMTLGAVIKRMNKDKEIWSDPNYKKPITVHGFRTTFRMWAAEQTDHPREVAEHALAHQLPNAVERAYQRGTQFPKRVALMKEWSAYCHL